MQVQEFLLFAPVSLFVIINPFSAVPVFLAITPGSLPEERIKAARTACLVACSIIFFFAVTGQFLFTLLGITLPAFQIAGGVLLFSIAFEMMRTPDLPLRLNAKEKRLAAEKEDIAVTPLAVPLLCGPGAVSTVIILQTQAITVAHTTILLLSVPVVFIACYLVLRLSVSGASWLNPFILRILRRLMGLLFAAIAVQFVINGISALPFVAD